LNLAFFQEGVGSMPLRSPLMSMLGGRLIDREDYLKLLEQTRRRGLQLFD